MIIEKDTCTSMFTVALFTIARTWKKPRCPSTDERIKKLWNIHAREHFSSVAQSCQTLYDPMDCSTPGLPVHLQLPEFTQTHVHWVGDAIQPSHPLSSPSLPTFNLSQHQGLSNESVLCIRWIKYWCFSFSISPFSQYSGMNSFRMDWLILLSKGL